MYYDIEKAFSYHAPNEDQKQRHQLVRMNAKTFAHILEDYVPSSPEFTLAMRKLEECVYYANAAIARVDVPARNE